MIYSVHNIWNEFQSNFLHPKCDDFFIFGDFVHDTNSDSRHFSKVGQMDQILAAVNPNAN